MSEVLIVGAGMAGLACAARLQAAGWSVQVLDKGRQLGGRVASRRTGGLCFDHGAQFLSIQDPAFEAALAPARRAGVLQAWQAPGRAAPAWVGAPSFQHLPQWLGEGLAVQLSTEVVAVEAAAAGWTLATRSGEAAPGRIHTRRLVLTAPAPQLQALLGAAAPAALATIRYDPCWTLMLRADRPLALPVGADPHPAIGWITAEATKPGRDPAPCWTVQAGPAWSRDHLEETPAAVSAALCAILSTLSAEPLAAFEVVAAHRWRYARVTSALPAPMWMPEQGLGLAGDGFAGPRIEAAWRSGWMLAGRMLAST